MDGRLFIQKRQKLIKIADKCRDGWQVVAEYESDELASGSEDERRLRKAWEAAGRKRRRKEQAGFEGAKHRRVGAGSDNQLFRRMVFTGESTLNKKHTANRKKPMQTKRKHCK